MLPSGRLAWKPKLVEALGASDPLCAAFRAVTVCPLVVNVAFQDPVIVCPAGRVKVTVQPLMAAGPVLVTVTGWMT